jgi:hypothetical protein
VAVVVPAAVLAARAGLPRVHVRAQASRAGARGRPAGRAASAGGGRLLAARARTPGGVARVAPAKGRAGRRTPRRRRRSRGRPGARPQRGPGEARGHPPPTEYAGERARHRRTRRAVRPSAALTRGPAGQRGRDRRPTERAGPARVPTERAGPARVPTERAGPAKVRRPAGRVGAVGHRCQELRGPGPVARCAAPPGPLRETSHPTREIDRSPGAPVPAPRAPDRVHRAPGRVPPAPDRVRRAPGRVPPAPGLAPRGLHRVTGRLGRAPRQADRATAVSVPRQGPASGARRDPPETSSAGALESRTRLRRISAARPARAFLTRSAPSSSTPMPGPSCTACRTTLPTASPATW